MVILTYILVSFTIAIQSTSGKDVNLNYTTVSYTLDGKPCINDCVNSKCVVDQNLNEETCEYSDLPAPIYYTSVSHTLRLPTCLSRCGLLSTGSSYEQCFISNTEVDYCVSEVQNNWLSSVTLSKTGNQNMFFEINADYCELDGYSDMCIDAQGNIHESDLNKSYRTLEATNIIDIAKTKCQGECKIESQSYKTCAGTLCAPIAQAPPLKEFYKDIPVDGCMNSINDQSMRQAIANSNYSNIFEAAVKLQKSNYFATMIYRDDRNPIINCTMKPSKNYGDAVLPLVIQAKITSDTIRSINQLKRERRIPAIVTKNLERMLSLPSDVPRTLIGYQLGGPTTICNVAPLLPSLSEILTSYEKEVYNWVNEDEFDQADVNIKGVQQQGDLSKMNSVDMTVVVMYENTSRPSAIGVDIAYLKGDVEAKERISKLLCNQDPKQEAFVMNMLKRYCGKNFLISTNTGRA